MCKAFIALSSVFIVAFYATVSLSFSQPLQVTPNNNAVTLAGLLAGTGVTISNATKNCPNGASGTFNGSTTNLGIDSGIVLTSGQAIDAVGPNNSSFAGTYNGVYFSDPSLVAIEPFATYDPCILRFTAVPSCTTLSFTFSFGSEEYPEFVNSIFNDVFGIFVTGPNPSGPAYNGSNIARIPGSTTPVSINTVNNGPAHAGPCVNCAYYVDNSDTSTTIPYTTVQYDGFTKAITVTLKVVPCASYQFKLAIADAGDGYLDSGVFFELQSLACNSSLALTITPTPAQCAVNNGSAIATIAGGTQPYTYSWNPTGQTTQTATGLGPGNYTVTVTDAGGCLKNTATVTITQPVPITASITNVTNVSCFGLSNGSASVNTVGGTGVYSYLWNSSPAQTGATASNLIAGNYIVAITDANGCTDTQNVTITEPPPVIADFVSSSDTFYILDPPVVVYFSNLSSGASQWLWNFGDLNAGVSILQNPSYTFSDTGTYCVTLIASDSGGICKDSIVHCIEVLTPFLFYIPNAFTPNSDGHNELFAGKGTYIREFKMYVFDRWGNLIFKSNDLHHGWDGKVNSKGEIVEEDVYVWKVNIIDMNGEPHNYTGHVNLIK